MHKHRLKHKRKYLEHIQTNSAQLSGNWIMGHESLAVDQEDRENSLENSEDTPSSDVFNDTKTTSTSSHKSRRSLQKRVVSVPVKEIERSRLKSEVNAPPSDSWAWRKYGQKPIKGSPYPRGYYKCSSSKGCPARKQVERNRADPTMVIVTYSCDHNHPPASRHNNKNHHKNSSVSPPAASTPTTTQEEVSNIDDQEEDSPQLSKQSIVEPEFSNLEVANNHLGWFSDLESLSSTMLESPLLARDIVCDADMAMIFSVSEEDESLFADLGELPECAMVFR
ncbi:putative transcription factor WRKY family [Helianthus annuus]|uniref:Putative WRKY domain-containing protein n=1 Tax=Helianthus annuus TaxID=4232 RepID=A0A251TK76_HELAN|nr:putative transcription factor WRKY family [Helianthus annuus]KAJ0430139.1 putative transcription factor WRKY family [Helianthus annuus]KAJ0434891.1 putative transcription factor WRKY family [Helianthus annuus]KAJ0448556.1 putative transcription factor WRKY family [Helianthus annuus]KAJ0633435.1 putative transcription factor WRKY family [Helianthus annuus]